MTSPIATQAERLRRALEEPSLLRLAGAHNALGARLAERAGFDAVWAGSLEISASHGVPDAGILGMSEFLAAATEMVRAVEIPVVADCESGFGNAINVMHMVREYEAAGVAAVCIDDRRFPKVNSLLSGPDELADPAEVVGKLEAAKNAQRGDAFIVIARVEALVVGDVKREALRRSQAYARAGADAILIHDTSPTPDAIIEFCEGWDDEVPLVVVPTTYSSVTAQELEACGVRVVIYANHGLRAQINAIERTFSRIIDDGTSAEVEQDIAPLSTVFELQGQPDLAANETRYVRGNGHRSARVLSPVVVRENA